MLRRTLFVLSLAILVGAMSSLASAQAPTPSPSPMPTQGGAKAFGRTWGGAAGANDWERFYHYPYFFYPQNYWGQDYYKSSDSLYHRYPNEMRIPTYNRKWHNPYPTARPYHSGHHFMLDVF